MKGHEVTIVIRSGGATIGVRTPFKAPDVSLEQTEFLISVKPEIERIIAAVKILEEAERARYRKENN